MRLGHIGLIFFGSLVIGLIFKSGELYNYYSTRPIAIEHQCAHYDMTTGNFKWGAPPITVMSEAIPDEVAPYTQNKKKGIN